MNDDPSHGRGAKIVVGLLALAVVLSVLGGVLIGYRYLTMPTVKSAAPK